MYLKISEREGKKVVASCDSELIGKVLKEGEATLDLDKYSSFYRGGEVGAEKLAEALKDFSSANLVGKECVAVALESGLVRETDVRYINNVPHVQVYRV